MGGERASVAGGGTLGGGVPILVDLAGQGIKITEFERSQRFVDPQCDGLSHRSAWAGVGEAVLFFDLDGRNAITENRQYIFTEWDPTANSDLDGDDAAFRVDSKSKSTAHFF